MTVAPERPTIPAEAAKMAQRTIRRKPKTDSIPDARRQAREKLERILEARRKVVRAWMREMAAKAPSYERLMEIGKKMKGSLTADIIEERYRKQ